MFIFIYKYPVAELDNKGPMWKILNRAPYLLAKILFPRLTIVNNTIMYIFCKLVFIVCIQFLLPDLS